MELVKGYKQTEIGVIPEDWKINYLPQVGQVLNGLTYSPSNVTDYGTLVLRSSNIQNDALSFENNVFVKMELPEKVIVKENDILICVRNGSKNLIGKCALIDEKTAGNAFGAFMSVFRTDYSKYIFFQFQFTIIQKQINQVLGATINQITKKDLSNFQIPLPPTLSEQKNIAQVLNDVDQLIQNLKTLIAKKKAIKQGGMQELLTSKKGWQLKKLGEILQFGSGKDYKHLRSGRIPVYGTGGIMTFVDEYLFDGESVGIGRKGTIDKPVFLKGKFWTVDTLFFTHSFKDSNPKYIYYQFQLIKWKEYNEASGVPSLNKNTLEQIEIHIPSFIEQTRISNILTDMDSEIEALEIQLQKSQNLKQGMMQELLTGKTRLVKPDSQSANKENRSISIAAEPETVYKRKLKSY